MGYIKPLCLFWCQVRLELKELLVENIVQATFARPIEVQIFPLISKVF